MTFDISERSNYGGTPVTLYEFIRGGQVFRYANSETPVTDNGVLYEGINISDEGLRQSSDSRSDEVTITLENTAAINSLYNNTPPSQEVRVIIRRKHLGTNFSSVVWSGFVSTHTQIDGPTCEIVARSVLASLNRLGLRLSWGRQCPYALYDRSCKVPKSQYAVVMQVSAIQGFRLTLPGSQTYGNNWFKGGFIEIQLPNALERRSIEWHNSNNVGILEGVDGIEVGMMVTAYPGCDRNVAVCVSKFDNLLNYGGVPQLPDSSPFDQNPF